MLYAFVPESELRDKAAFATDRLARSVAGGVKRGVQDVGRRAKGVPGKIERGRAERKIRWLQDRGYASTSEERVTCGTYAGAWHGVA